MDNMEFEQTDIEAFNIIYSICNETYTDFESFKHIGISKCLFIGLYRGLFSTRHLMEFSNVISNCNCCSRHLQTCSRSMNLDKTCKCTCRKFMRRCMYSKILYDKFIRTGEKSCLLNDIDIYLMNNMIY